VDQVLLAHGSGGMMMHELIEKMFIDEYGSDILTRGDDAAVLSLPKNTRGALDPTNNAMVPGTTSGAADTSQSTPSLAFSTDSFVVTPHFFPGGDIGRLAVCGTVNDVATSGARPLWLSVAFVLEEGFALADLRRVCTSIARTAREAGVQIVTGDTKVVERGGGDGIYINTSGVGVLPTGVSLSGTLCKPGDSILISGTLGDHGIAIISAREGLRFETTLESDAAPLNHLIAAALEASPHIRCFRDPTRGGLASTLNELATQSNTVMLIDEEAIPVRDQVRGACEMLGYDVLQVANEGKVVCVVAADEADAALTAMKNSRYGADAALIGTVCAVEPKRGNAPCACVRTAFGSERILDMLVGEQLPRIC
jgi:hydrogenase expression/formation protein HypE